MGAADRHHRLSDRVQHGDTETRRIRPGLPAGIIGFLIGFNTETRRHGGFAGIFQEIMCTDRRSRYKTTVLFSSLRASVSPC